MEANRSVKKAMRFGKICVILMAAYIVLAAAFYFLAGKQLHLRPSEGNVEMPEPEAITTELTQGMSIEQVFHAKIQRLQSVSVRWGTFNRPNTGTVYIELYDTRDSSLIMSDQIDAGTITESGTTTMSPDSPIETLYDIPLLLRIYADSPSGGAVTPLMASSAEAGGFSLRINGEPTEGILCFSASGEDRIWTGLHYWELAAALGAAIALYLLFIYRRWRKGKASAFTNALAAMQKYGFLIKQLVGRDFKAKYKRSILGVLWSFLNPLLTMLVQYIVFSNLFRFDVPYYPVYLLSGIVIFNFFSEACGMALGSIIGNASLITKVYVPKYIYPLTRVMSSFINLLISMIPLLAVIFLSGLSFTKAFLLLPFVLICLAVFCLGLGMILASAMVFFRDTQFLWGVLSMIWMYLTPIFYPVSILPDNISWVLNVNPIYYFIAFVRTCVMDGVSPEPMAYIQCFLFALGFLLAGAFVFKKTQDKFVLYL